MRFVNTHSVLKLTFMRIHRRGVMTRYAGSSLKSTEDRGGRGAGRGQEARPLTNPGTAAAWELRTAGSPWASDLVCPFGAKESNPMGLSELSPLTGPFVDYLPHCYEWFLHNTNPIFFSIQNYSKGFHYLQDKSWTPIIANKTNVGPVISSLLVWLYFQVLYYLFLALHSIFCLSHVMWSYLNIPCPFRFICF